MAKFDQNDDGVVVIIGSGAGGGTLGNELAQKGVKVVILEAGARIENQDFINDEWDSFTQLAWSDKRTTSGSWRVHKDFPNLPAWIVKTVGGSTTALGRRVAALPRARVQDQDAPMATCPAPTCSTGRSRWPSWSRTTPRPRTRWA